MLYIFPNETGPEATSPLPLALPAGRRSDKWTATPAPCRRACDTNLQLASSPSLPSIESSTLKTVQDTGSLEVGSLIHSSTRPVREINDGFASGISQLGQLDMVVYSLVLSLPFHLNDG